MSKTKMKKKYIVINVVVILVLVVGVYMYATGFFDSEETKEAKVKTQQIKKIKKTKFATLPVISIDEAEQKINNGEDFIAYYAWVNECGDARLFEANSFDDYLTDEKINKKIYVIDLDKDIPDALIKPELRKPYAKRLLIDTWTKDDTLNPMELKSPQLVHYKDRRIVDLVSWTVINSHAKYGMMPERTQAFFDKLK